MKRTLLAVGVLLLLALFLLPSPRASAASRQVKPFNNFTASCSGISVSGSGILTATCRMRNGQPHFTALDLNPHVGNNNGTLVADGSNFVASCSNIGGTSILTASCRRRDGTLNNTALDLNANVDNTNGTLVWG